MPQSTVTSVYENKVNTKNGSMDVYSVYLQGVDGKMGSGFDSEVRSACKDLQKGDLVEYEAQKNKKGYLELKSIRKVPKSNTATNNQSTQEDRQESIIRQSSLGYAATIVAPTLRKGDNLSYAAEEVIRIAEQYFRPYAKGEFEKNWEEEAQEENNRTQDQQEATPDDDTDLPF